MSTLADDSLAAAPISEREIPGPSLTDLLLVTMSLIWGINYTVVKYGTSVIAPLAYNGVRVTMAAVALLALVWWTKRPIPSKRDTLTLLALGVLGNGIYQLLFIEGVARTRAGDAALVLAASPAFIAIFGRVLGVERITGRGVVGILLSLAGMAFVVYGRQLAPGGDGRATLTGNALVLCGSVAWSLYSVLLKPRADHLGHPLDLRLHDGGGRDRDDPRGTAGDRGHRLAHRVRRDVGRDGVQRHLRPRHRVSILVPRRAGARTHAHGDVLEPPARDRARRRLGVHRRSAHALAGARRRHDHRGRRAHAHMRLVLFDIDGTLLWSDGAGRRSMTVALTEAAGSAGPAGYRYDGKTDGQIVRDLLAASGKDAAEIDAITPAIIARYLALLADDLRERRLRLFPGVAELLDAVEADRELTLGLLTGNVREGAELKLRAAGVDFSRFRVGAFGSDHHERPELPAIAQRRFAEAHGLSLAGDRVVVIGDTPADIACGRGIGARAIAVATGHFKVEDLANHAPAAVFASLEDTAAVMRAIRDE